MKKLSDYVGDEAIELWADLFDPISAILSDVEVANVVRSTQPKLAIAKVILKNHKEDTEQILLRIDPEPITGLNIITRLLAILSDIGSNPEIKSFFVLAEQEKMENVSSGSVMENIKAAEI